MERPFVNCFWGDGTAGFLAVRTRIHDGLNTLHELLDYYHDRVQLERDYAKRLHRLNAKTTVGSRETGSLRAALDKLALENAAMAAYSDKFAKSVTQQSYDRLHSFTSMYTKRALKIESHMAKLAGKRAEAHKQLEAARTRFQEECAQIKLLRLMVQTTWGKELEKNEAKLRKMAGPSGCQHDYELAVVRLREIDDIYVRDWSLALQDIYLLEIERIQTCKINCFGYCNQVATLCVDNDLAADVARLAFALVAPPADLDEFARNHGTGDKIYDAPGYVDYMGGYSEEERTFHAADFDNPDCKDVMRSVLKKEYQRGEGPRRDAVAHGSPQAPQTPSKPPKCPEKTGFLRQSPRSPGSPTKTPAKPSPPQPSASHTPSGPSQRSKLQLSPESPHVNRGGSVTSAYALGHEDVFSANDKKFTGLNGSTYSNVTSYSSSSNLDRHWASPRRKEKQLSQYQEQINRLAKEPAAVPAAQEPPAKPVPLTKDFSIDFIAKALEDLNNGGDGDVLRFRRSLRGSATAPATPCARREEAPAQGVAANGDFGRTLDRRHFQQAGEKDFRASFGTRTAETPQPVRGHARHESIAFLTPGPQRTRADLDGSPVKPRPKLMVDTTNDLLATCIVHPSEETLTAAQGALPRRSLLRSPSRKFKNLHSIIAKKTPHTHQPYVSQARARYTYKSQQQGELSFKKGWLMYVIHRQEDNWYVCELAETGREADGAVGLVPGNYVTEGEYM